MLSLPPNIIDTFTQDAFAVCSVDPQIKALQHRLYKRVLYLAKKTLTDSQYECFDHYYIDDNRLTEVASEMNITKQGVYSKLNGSLRQTKTSNEWKRAGGINKALKDICANDKVIQHTLKKIKAIRDRNTVDNTV